MAGLARAIAVFGAVSVIGTATQVAKGKIGALLLGAAGVGVLNQLTTLYSVLFIVAGLGFFNGLMRQISLAVKDGDGSAARAQMNSVTLFSGATSLAITIVCLFLAPQISDLLFGDNGERSAFVAIAVLAVPIAVQQRIFRAYLNSMRDVKAISRAQVFADVSSVAFFALGTWQYGIWGGIAAFVIMHATLLAGMAYFSVKSGGAGLALPNPRYFAWSEIVPNFGYGINGMVLTVVASGSAIIIGRMIISESGLAEAGIFSVAFKVATVYLGALYSAAGSYYFPTLVRLESREALQEEINRAVALYMAILPPVIAGLIAFGDILIPLLFSREFLPAVMVMAGLLLGDVLRVTSETMALSLLAQKRLVPYTILYLVYAAGFLGLSWHLLPQYGLIGIALAYVTMRIFDFLAVQFACARSLGVGLTKDGAIPFLLALGWIIPVVAAEFAGLGLVFKLAIATALGLLWLALSWNLSEFAKLRKSVLSRLAPR